MTVMLGCIADDFTGATDLAGMLVEAGMRTVQMIGVPTTPLPDDVDAIVIALKSRTSPVETAVADSVAALNYLREAGCSQFYFKYCSTFDSTDKGNIGPVTDMLMEELGTKFTIACPAFPENKRTIYKGHLFVEDVLLSESGMRYHPLTPMSDSNLVQVLQRQSKHTVGLIDWNIVNAGGQAIRDRMQLLQADGINIAVVDAISNKDLLEISEACVDLPLITAGSGLATGITKNLRGVGVLPHQSAKQDLPLTTGKRAIICGSCSQATQAQLNDALARGTPGYFIDPVLLADGSAVVEDALAWAAPRLLDGPVVIYATAPSNRVKRFQDQLGRERAGALVEQALARIAQGLVKLGVTQLVVAGGETSGAVVSALAIKGLRIGPQIDPGVPWTVSLGDNPISLALKSGNFGSVDFFYKAWSLLNE